MGINQYVSYCFNKHSFLQSTCKAIASCIVFHNCYAKNETKIGTLGKAPIYQNDYGVWQFRTWLADGNKKSSENKVVK